MLGCAVLSSGCSMTGHCNRKAERAVAGQPVGQLATRSQLATEISSHAPLIRPCLWTFTNFAEVSPVTGWITAFFFFFNVQGSWVRKSKY